MTARTVTVTDAWFDGYHPNPLHPVGVIINNSLRRVEVPLSVGRVEAPDGSARSPVTIRRAMVATGAWMAWRGWRIILDRLRQPTPRELWGRSA